MSGWAEVKRQPRSVQRSPCIAKCRPSSSHSQSSARRWRRRSHSFNEWEAVSTSSTWAKSAKSSSLTGGTVVCSIRSSSSRAVENTTQASCARPRTQGGTPLGPEAWQLAAISASQLMSFALLDLKMLIFHPHQTHAHGWCRRCQGEGRKRSSASKVKMPSKTVIETPKTSKIQRALMEATTSWNCASQGQSGSHRWRSRQVKMVLNWDLDEPRYTSCLGVEGNEILNQHRSGHQAAPNPREQGPCRPLRAQQIESPKNHRCMNFTHMAIESSKKEGMPEKYSM